MPNSLCTLEFRHTIGSLRNVVTLMSESFLAGFFREHRGVLSTRLRPLFFYKQYSDDSEVLVTLLQRQFAELRIFSLAGTWFLPLQVLTHFVLNVLVSPNVLSQTKVYCQMYT